MKNNKPRTSLRASRQVNEQKILQAAEREFEAHGYGGARMQRIADLAGLPKANVHYYFPNKQDLYIAVLSGIVDLWNSAFGDIHVDDDPAAMIESYIRAKLRYSQQNARAARIFTMEMIQGAPHLHDYLTDVTNKWIEQRVAVLNAWKEQGKVGEIDPYHLIFMIWSTTQYYADYHAQIALIFEKSVLDETDFEQFANSLVDIILTGCRINKS
ncbi:MAG: TetR family transcriptional regulator C-terminal domain-containing protein [Pseudomonadota bacterium]